MPDRTLPDDSGGWRRIPYWRCGRVPRYLQGRFINDWLLASRVTWILERARLVDRLGQTETALRDYRFVSQVWADADPELQPLVREAEEAVARLGGSSSGSGCPDRDWQSQ